MREQGHGKGERGEATHGSDSLTPARPLARLRPVNPSWRPLATTGVGSLPVADEADALHLAGGCDVPYLPELPALVPSEAMPSSMTADSTARLERLLGMLSPMVRWVKVQTAGPLTAAVGVGRVVERALRLHRLHRLLVAHGRGSIVILDEPMLTRAAPSDELREALSQLRAAGARVGVHCCGETDWEAVLCLPLELVSFDVECSLERLTSSPSWPSFSAKGGAIFGVVPTTAETSQQLEARCSRLLRRLAETTPHPRALLERSLISPACGLAHRTRETTIAAFRALDEARARLWTD